MAPFVFQFKDTNFGVAESSQISTLSVPSWCSCTVTRCTRIAFRRVNPSSLEQPNPAPGSTLSVGTFVTLVKASKYCGLRGVYVVPSCYHSRQSFPCPYSKASRLLSNRSDEHFQDFFSYRNFPLALHMTVLEKDSRFWSQRVVMEHVKSSSHNIPKLLKF
jgi:hypothetical protein